MFRWDLRAAGLIAVCGLLTLTGACTSGKSSDRGTASTANSTSAGGTPAPSQTPGAADFALPIDSYAYTNQQNTEIVLAQSILTGTCMQRFGFTYDLAADQAGMQHAQQIQAENFGVYGNKRRYGVTDEATARKDGYHLPSAVGGTAAAKPAKGGPAHGLPAMTPAMSTVLNGERPDGGKAPDVGGQAVPKGGCRGTAHSTLSKLGTVGEIPLVGQIRADSFTRSVTDPKVTTAFKNWSACMSGKGYHYDTPRDAGADLNIDTPVVSPREIAIASADVACKKSADLVRIWSSFEINYQNAQIDQNAQELKDVAQQRDKLVKQVGQIIAAGGK